MRRIALVVLVGLAVSGTALADGIADMRACKRMAEPLDELVPVCTQALNSNDLNEVEIGETFLHRGWILLKLGEVDGAMVDLGLAIDYNPEVGWAYFLKGLAYETLGEEKRADGQFKNAFFYDPENVEIAAKMADRGLL
ncbi:MAG: hypothetical protein HOB82_07665 [Alphaproteobacteria bacterium]|jgi:tetratricopeptide (TPR) repeat protein|nr:hypothetical protein [Alphaproteobacteria bacterium]